MTKDEKVDALVDIWRDEDKTRGRLVYWNRHSDELKERKMKLLDELEYSDYLKASLIYEELKGKKEND